MEGRDSLMDLRHPVTSWTSLATTQRLIFQVYSRARSWPTRPAPGERPQHQRRADHGHPVTRSPGQHPASAPAPGVPVVEVWQIAGTRRAATAPGPGRPWAPGHQASTSAGQIMGNQASTWRARAVKVWAWCSCIQRQHLASGHSTRAGQTVGNQASAWRATSGGGVPVVHGPCHQVTTSAGQITATRSPGERPSAWRSQAVEVCQIAGTWRAATAPAPGVSSGGDVPDRGHQASAWQIAATRSPGQPKACPWWRCASGAWALPQATTSAGHIVGTRSQGERTRPLPDVPERWRCSRGRGARAQSHLETEKHFMDARWRGASASKPSTSAGPPCHQASTWRATAAGQVTGHQHQASTWQAPQHQHHRPAPGRQWAPGHQFPGQRLACHQHQRRATRQPGMHQHRERTSGGGVGVVPVHPTPAPGERPQHRGRADRGHQATRRAHQACHQHPRPPGHQASAWQITATR